MSMKKADIAFSKYIRARDGRCVKCGSDRYLQCAHIITRSYKAIRTDEHNAVALCRSCHMYYTHHPLEWFDWVEEQFPGRLSELRDKALTYARVDWKLELSKYE